MTFRSLLTALCLALVLPAAARAQETETTAAAPLEDRPAIKLNEVEHGVFFGFTAGGGMLFGPAKSPDSSSGLSTGRSAGITVGTEIGTRLSIAGLVLGLHVDTPAGFESPGELRMRGDFSSLLLGGLAQLAVLAKADANKVPRFYVNLRGGAGVGLMDPKGFFEGADTFVLVGAGLLYHTRLRHLAVGLDADLLYGLTNMGAGVLIAPTVRYTF